MKTPLDFFLNMASAFCLFLPSATAQNIPDPNFANAIRWSCPACIDTGNNLTPAAQNLTNLYVFGSNVSNLAGIEGFINLKYLDCSYNQLNSLPNLPNSLTKLDCYDNQLSSLPALPSTLTKLDCYNNQLNSLPVLPNSLTGLYCHNNQLNYLPVLPNSLTGLYCHNNQLNYLPALPDSLKVLICSNNKLDSLPALPNALTDLYCYNNQLSFLPALPDSLTVLNCDTNQLGSLPSMPASLLGLKCSNNQLSSLPALPHKLSHLECSNNQLSSLPALPNNLRYLECSYNSLSSLPAYPDSLRYLYCSGNQLGSLPALPVSLKFLICGDNPSLFCLPFLPNGLVLLMTWSTQITCIPNQPTDLFMVPELPLCSQPCNPMLSIHNAPPAQPFVIQPNPVTDFIHVNFPNDSGAEAEILLFNANGQIIHLLRGKGNLTISAEDFPAGIYWLKLKMAEGIFWKKIVKL